MSEPNDQGDQVQDDQQPGDQGTPPAEQPNEEAKRYRLRLREAEQQRDALAQRVEAMQRSEVETLAAEHLNVPSALWKADGVELASLLTDDGAVDADKVREAALAARESLGLERRSLGLRTPGEGKNRRPSNKTSFEDAFKPL